MSETKKLNNFTIEGAKIFGRNFSGKEALNNPKGKRTFCLRLDVDEDGSFAQQLKEDGWNVKVRDDEFETPFLPIEARYENYPPKIYLVTSTKKKLLTSETIDQLDWTEIKNIDITVTPSVWSMNGKSGVKAYVKSMYVRVIEDTLAEKYADLEEY